jgi:transketolase
MNETTKNLRKQILRVSAANKSGHIASAFSILECLYSIYFEVLKPEDVFILSKGHGSLALYAVMLEKNLITIDEFESFAKFDSKLGGHPDRNKHPHIFASTGSLGHGLPMAVGVALSRKIQGKEGKVYCLVGDGECNEGSVWESALLASHFNLRNIVCIVDDNNSQIRSVPTSELCDKFSSFKWKVINVENGHDIDSITRSLRQDCDGPTCVIAHTVKGHGVSKISSEMFSWHHRPPTQEELKDFEMELSK